MSSELILLVRALLPGGKSFTDAFKSSSMRSTTGLIIYALRTDNARNTTSTHRKLCSKLALLSSRYCRVIQPSISILYTNFGSRSVGCPSFLNPSGPISKRAPSSRSCAEFLMVSAGRDGFRAHTRALTDLSHQSHRVGCAQPFPSPRLA